MYQVRIFDQEHPVLVNACSATKLQNDRLDSSKLAEQVAALPDRTAAAEFSTAGQSSRPVPPAEVDVCLAQHQSASGAGQQQSGIRDCTPGRQHSRHNL